MKSTKFKFMVLSVLLSELISCLFAVLKISTKKDNERELDADQMFMPQQTAKVSEFYCFEKAAFVPVEKLKKVTSPVHIVT